MSELVYYDLKGSASMSPSLPVQVARELGRRIVAGHFEPGSLIDDENALAERYQVSRVVVRDAVKILVSKGLLDVRRGIGTKVRPRTQWVMLDDDVLAWHLTSSPTPDFLKQLMDIRLAFEPKAARWAAERGSKEDIDGIRQAIVRMELEVGSVEGFVIADAKFHRSILKAAHNEFISAMEGVIYSAILVSVRLTNQDIAGNKNSVPYHRRVFEAIAGQDGDEAERLTIKLLSDACERLGKELGGFN
ncbi:FadR family transcriptional regulator [Gilvimarinus agarilyticus]|uniref:FadR/GntR family transcriptional regulator n=1 Tax=Gilvimarinus sp. 2_MG-2023 TaxID=3062666 RepID=UPI001C089BC4|nr:FadR/GntR family transcriptional regulator [Gilvimarinus sp. 2_MG-2023]MBU2886363.1 FadR family transcriptional regulator [Gilvimarinus agarilyticus]MDO6571042.1 FadR/GntR family transcriptional regulator [Gilvimarinus sp. 2_MG-2023]